MEVVLSITIIVLLLSIITFLQNVKKEEQNGIRRHGISERDYLYAHKGVLQKFLNIENDLQNIIVPTDRYPQDKHIYFSAIEVLHIKQQTTTTLKELMDKYAQGLIDINSIHTQLDDLSKRLHVLFFSVAA